MTTPYPGHRAKELESGIHHVDTAPSNALLCAWRRYPGRWDNETLLAATRVQRIFDGVSVEECATVLDNIEKVRVSLQASAWQTPKLLR